MSSFDTTKSVVSLVDMPDLPLKHIFSFVGFRTLQSLRLVSKPLCKFIDTEKPSVQIDDLRIKINQHGVELKLKSSGINSHLEIYKHENGSGVTSGDKTWYYEDTDYLDFSLDLLKYLLNTQTAHTIKRIGYSDDRDSKVMKMFQEFLTDQKIILRVREFSFDGHEHQALPFLPFLDSNILENLSFCWIHEKDTSDDLMQLEQWKKAKTLFSIQKTFRVPIQNFGHFETARFHVYSVTAQDLVYMKEKYSQSPNFSRATIYCERSDSPTQVFGEPPKEDKWVFRCSDPNYVLIIDYRYRLIRWCRTHISSMPNSPFL